MNTKISKTYAVDDVECTSATSKVDARGQLHVFQSGTQFAFLPTRVFTVHADKGAKRGHHAHKKCWQALSCISGSCLVQYRDGLDRSETVLTTPNQVLIIPPGIWAEQQYNADGTILMVLCDQPYDEKDYLRNWNEFLAWRSLATDKV